MGSCTWDCPWIREAGGGQERSCVGRGMLGEVLGGPGEAMISLRRPHEANVGVRRYCG